jgi:thiol-disulfide isomerase/thioredoxin
MSETPSNMMPLGTQAPDFYLLDTQTGKQKKLVELQGAQGTVIIFMCNHCPYVLYVKKQLIAMAEKYAPLGINVIAISANDVNNYPQDAPDKMQSLMKAWGNPFAAYLYDETQAVAKAYLAACTPDFYLFNTDLNCVYRGRLDAATPKNNKPLSGEDLRNALDALLAGTENSAEQIPSVGCNIKWKD